MTEALSRPQAITKVAEMIKEIRIAMLSTVTSEGAIHSRPMASREAEFQGELLSQAEYWEAPANAVMRGYQLLKAAVTKGGSRVGEHQAVAL
jgi:hypothetical protein